MNKLGIALVGLGIVLSSPALGEEEGNTPVCGMYKYGFEIGDASHIVSSNVCATIKNNGSGVSKIKTEVGTEISTKIQDTGDTEMLGEKSCIGIKIKNIIESSVAQGITLEGVVTKVLGELYSKIAGECLKNSSVKTEK